MPKNKLHEHLDKARVKLHEKLRDNGFYERNMKKVHEGRDRYWKRFRELKAKQDKKDETR